jgi:deoxyribodipyrimidine photo-lyase
MPTLTDFDTMTHYDRGLMWFRRDLRTEDNAALYHALKRCRQVWCVFVFDTEILDPLPRQDRRVEFIHASVLELDRRLDEWGQAHGNPGAGLIVRHALAREEIPRLAQQLHVQAVFANHDDEPASLARDAQILGALAHAGVVLHTHKDHVVFERREVLTQAGHPFGVFTPYKNAWLRKVEPSFLKAYPCANHGQSLAPKPAPFSDPLPRLSDIDFSPSNLSSLPIPTGASGAQALLEDFMERIERYDQARNFPAIKGPSYLSVHLRFGTVSIRQLVSVSFQMHLQDIKGASTWLSELIWRDFYHQIMANFPHVISGAFKPDFDKIRFEHGKHAQALFAAWCEGRTGYPLIDAAMAQINHTGYMHNRLRMVVASFLVKDLGIDWRWGERYFAEKLIDFDLAANNGGWQWAASTGCDAQPWFRIFNPVTQSEKFDAEGKFIRRYLPQLAGLSNAAIHAPWQASELELLAADVALDKTYPRPIVDHALARVKTLERYAIVKR